MCGRWCATKLCVKDGVWQSCVWKMVCDKVVCGRWCVTKLCVEDGVWQSCVWKMVCDKAVCGRWCVTKLCVEDGVWQSCVWKMVCDKVVLTNWCLTCHAKRRWLSPSATPATQKAQVMEGRCRQAPRVPRKTTAGSRASRATKRTQARHQTQPSPINATLATQNAGRIRSMSPSATPAQVNLLLPKMCVT